MAIDYDRLMTLEIADIEHSYAAKDTILYALGLGLGQDPMSEDELAFVYEKGLQALPTMACVLAPSGRAMREADTGIDWLKVVHGEQSFRLHRLLPAAGTVIGKPRITDVIDKGAGKGAVLSTERTLTDKATGERLATLTHTTFCRGDGGFGGPRRESAPPRALPDRSPDAVCDLPTRPEAALIYRLSGDYNPLHSDPAHARAAGFPRPILHGLATFGVAGHALLKTLCGYDPARLVAMEGRFSAPVYPGETIRTEIWRDGETVSYRAGVVGRDVTAISNGRAEIAA
jgi:acyl dehydratase